MSEVLVWLFDDDGTTLNASVKALENLGAKVKCMLLKDKTTTALKIAEQGGYFSKKNLPDVVVGDLILSEDGDGRNQLFELQTHLEAICPEHLSAWVVRTGQSPEKTHLGSKTNFEWAALYGFDWFIPKGQGHTNKEILEIGAGVKVIRKALDSMGSVGDGWRANLFCKILKVGKKDLEEIERFSPPQTELIKERKGRGKILIKWMLHQIIPYDGLLFSGALGSVRVGLKPGELDKIEEEGFLNQCAYQGAFRDLMGKRYWYHRLINFANSLCDKHNFSLYEEGGFAKSLNREYKITLKSQGFIDGLRPDQVDFFLPKKAILTTKAVRLQMGNRPSYSEPAWASLDSFADKYFIDDVFEADKHLLEDA
ncbi:MAG: hypothetical protein HY559_00240 [Gammaproteobacteria bacterium]|nr:hypothetical protein [Gammaproteobacteria bacterium]